ncbi:MAG: alpha/beta hydrolase family protein [Frankia sp.]
MRENQAHTTFRPFVAGGCLVALIAALTTGCSGGSTSSGRAGASGKAAVSSTAGAAERPAASDARRGCLPAGDPAASVAGGYGVGRITTTLVDRSRPTNADPTRHLLRKPTRTIPVTISYPTVRTGSATAVPGAPAAPGRFPLVVLSHGVTANGSVTAALSEPFVRAGYVVATPTFPLSSGPTGNISDLPNQPADVSFVITSMTTFDQRSGTPLTGHLAASCVAIAGHSLGAATTLAAAYLSCCRDARVKAVISMSGILAPFSGTFADAPPIPVLLLHGDQDLTVPIMYSQRAFATLRGPRYFVTLHGANHTSIFAPPAAAVLGHSVISFLDDYLKGDGTQLRALPSYVRRSGVASLLTAP